MISWFTEQMRKRFTVEPTLITKTPTEELLTDLEVNKVDVRLYCYDFVHGWKCHIEFEPGLLPGTRVDFDTKAFESPRQAVEAAHKYWFDHEHPNDAALRDAKLQENQNV